MPASKGLGAAGLVVAAIAGCSAGTVGGAQPCDASPCPGAGAATLAWIAPTTNADGTPLVDLAGYKLHYDTVGRGGDPRHVYANVVDIGMPPCSAVSGGSTECRYAPTLDVPSGTTLYLTVTAYDRAVPPNESAYANELSFTK